MQSNLELDTKIMLKDIKKGLDIYLKEKKRFIDENLGDVIYANLVDDNNVGTYTKQIISGREVSMLERIKNQWAEMSLFVTPEMKDLREIDLRLYNSLIEYLSTKELETIEFIASSKESLLEPLVDVSLQMISLDGNEEFKKMLEEKRVLSSQKVIDLLISLRELLTIIVEHDNQVVLQNDELLGQFKWL